MSETEKRGDLPSEKRGGEQFDPVADPDPQVKWGLKHIQERFAKETGWTPPPVRPLRADALDENPENGGTDDN